MDQLNYKIEGTEISEKIYAQYGILVLVLILLRISYHWMNFDQLWFIEEGSPYKKYSGWDGGH